MIQERIPLPPDKLRFMNEDDDKFLRIGRQCLDLLADKGFNRFSSLIDIGSGYGRLAYAILDRFDFQGNYTGVDMPLRTLGRGGGGAGELTITRTPSFSAKNRRNPDQAFHSFNHDNLYRYH
ncbi:MAG: hypothetical protein ACOY32_10285 [Thermodesulfobacteriota bacterium]